MIRLNQLLLGHRLIAVAVLVLCLAGVLTGVAIVQGRQQQVAAEDLVEHVLPAARLVRLVGQQVDDARGMEALHLLLRSASEREAVERQVAAVRRRVDARLVSYESGARDLDEREHLRAVKAALAAYWSAQDRLFAASRRAGGDLAAAETARLLLTGDSQATWRALAARLDAWWSYTELRAVQRARQSQQAAERGALVLTMVLLALVACGLSLTAVLAVVLLAARRRGAEDDDGAAAEPTATVSAAAAPPARTPDAGLGDLASTVAQFAPQAATLALGLTAMAGRSGAPLRELALAAAELRSLALHAEHAGRALRRHAAAGPGGVVGAAASAQAEPLPADGAAATAVAPRAATRRPSTETSR